MLIAFILFVIYLTLSWRILESYYMFYYTMPCDTMFCDTIAKNEDLEAALHWNA